MGGRAGTTQQINGGNSGLATPIPPGSLTDNYVVFGAGGDNIKIEKLLGQSGPSSQTLYTEPGISLDLSATAPVAGTGADVTITGGASGAGATGNGGAVRLSGGAAASTDGNGGAVNLQGGAGAGPGLRGLINFTGSFTLNTNEVTLNSNQDDYTGGDGYGVLKINATGNFNLTGLANPTSGRQLLIYNTGSSTCTLKHDTTSVAANRFYLPGAADLALAQYTGVLLEYAPTVARWVVVGMSVSSGAAGLANVAYVSKGGSDATAALGSLSKPYLTIAAAITAAAAAGTPYTIQLGPGTWTENLTWAEQLSLRGMGPLVSIVSGTLTLTAGATGTANSLAFEGVQITGASALNFAAKTAGDVSVQFNNCLLGSSWTLSRAAAGAYACAVYDTRETGGTFTVNFDNVIVQASELATFSFTASAGSEQVRFSGVRVPTVTLAGAGSTFRLTGCTISSAFTYSDGFGGTLVTSGCIFTSASITYTSGTWTQNGCVFTNSGYLASAAPGTVDLTYWGGVVNVTAAATLTLPATARKGYYLTVKNGNSVASGNNVTIARNGNSIEGSAADYVIGPLSSVTLMGDGTNWWVIS